MRRLIVNADDLGLTAGVNRAIVEAHRRGVVTSTTLMANGAAFDDAVCAVQEAPELSVGCHVVLVDGAPVLSPNDVPSLVPRGCAFRASIADLAAAAMRGRLAADEIEREVTAQIKKLQAAGIRVTHVDAHKHAHVLPQVLKPLLRAAAACGVPAVRNPFGALRPLAFAHLFRRPRLWTRYTEMTLLGTLAERFYKDVEAAGLVTADGSFGVVGTGTLDQTLFEAIIGCIPEGTWEFVCHPGYDDAELGQVRTRLRAARVLELQVLTAEASRLALERAGMELISYHELAHVPEHANS